jgi:hypothetical protein
MIRKPILPILLVTSALIVTGCAPKPLLQATKTPTSEWERARLLVRNQHPARIDVFLLHGQNRLWIGRVEPGAEGYFDLDAADLEEALRSGPAVVRLEVKPWGPGFAVRTDPVRIRRGRMIDWLIRGDLHLSRLRVH